MSDRNTSGDGVAATLESLQPRARSARSRALFLKRESNLRVFALQGLEEGWRRAKESGQVGGCGQSPVLHNPTTSLART